MASAEVKKKMSSRRKSWQEKLRDKKGLPKILMLEEEVSLL
jgi:hypothetical protein